jgi:hypothetical protein
MENPDLLELAHEVLPWVGVQATSLGVATRNVSAGQLGGMLYSMIKGMDTIDYEKRDLLMSSLRKVMELVDKACSVS